MIWIYDNAIVKDLKEDLGDNVAVLDPDQALQVIALLQEDKIKFPIVALSRDDNFQLDNTRMNFTRLHTGVPAGFDDKTNTIYHEQWLPINLQYNVTVMAANQADADEIVRELLFKYINQYFITVETPYEVKRQIRVGLTIHPDEEIQWTHNPSAYIENGTLISGQFVLYVEGAVLLSYRSSHLQSLDYDLELARDRKLRKTT